MHCRRRTMRRRRPEKGLLNSLAMTKSASGAGLSPVNRYALAKRTGCPEGIHRPPDGAALSSEGIRGQAQVERLPSE